MKIRLLFALVGRTRFSFALPFFNVFRKAGFFGILLSAFIVGRYRAQKTWTGTTSANWNTGTNWSPGGVPRTWEIRSLFQTTPQGEIDNPVVNAAAQCASLTLDPGNATRILTINSWSNPCSWRGGYNWTWIKRKHR